MNRPRIISPDEAAKLELDTKGADFYRAAQKPRVRQDRRDVPAAGDGGQEAMNPIFTPATEERDGVSEETVQQCIEVMRVIRRASVAMFQRRLRIGYTRAARVMDILEEREIVGPHKGAEPRDILVDLGSAEVKQ